MLQPRGAAPRAAPRRPGGHRPHAPSAAAARAARAARAAPRPRAAAAGGARAAELLQAVVNYRLEAQLPEGELVVRLLRPELLPRAADLLTDTFVDCKGVQPYRRYVRRNIMAYLEQHAKLPPEAVVLTAELHRVVPDGAEPDALMLGGALSELGGGSGRSKGSSSSSSSSSEGSSSSGGLQADQAEQAGFTSSRRNSHASSSSRSSTAEPTLGSRVSSALAQLASGLGLPAGDAPPPARTVAHLVGVAEVSFAASTRSTYLTLNPPARCAYLCNMAVDAGWRRRGVASTLIAAVEDVCCLAGAAAHTAAAHTAAAAAAPPGAARRRDGARPRRRAAPAGELDMFLHLRCKDDASAGGLYRKAGFAEHKRDWPVVALLGQEPRYLMRKQLLPARPLAGRVALVGQPREPEQVAVGASAAA
ncbi:hypothetical protein HT031_004300 [Scenedesmus sp. PABB004]|nr:hypothetical protein HT031_004300 [Scenedesmus sp. PABB004]